MIVDTEFRRARQMYAVHARKREQRHVHSMLAHCAWIAHDELQKRFAVDAELITQLEPKLLRTELNVDPSECAWSSGFCVVREPPWGPCGLITHGVSDSMRWVRSGINLDHFQVTGCSEVDMRSNLLIGYTA